jgi:hypothetical protein
MKRWKIALWTLVALLTIALGHCGYGLYHHLSVEIPDAYAVQAAAVLVIEYMDTHDGTWPSGWEDLREASRARGKTMDKLPELVEIDWHAHPADLVKVGVSDRRPPFKVIWLRDGSNVHWSSSEPNQMILEHLQYRARGKNP